MKRVFAPGCALMIYKPQAARRMLALLDQELEGVQEHLTCCKHEPKLPAGTQIINTCAGCDRRYRTLYPGVSTVSLWEVLCASRTFPFPDYEGQVMTVLDACPTRDQERVHEAVRGVLQRMNVKVAEPEKTRTKGVCCGDSLYGVAPVEKVKAFMKKRAAEMPAEDVAVYCVSCCKAMHIGGKKPRHLVDLLLEEETTPGTFEPDAWHAEIDAFIAGH